MTWTTNKWDVFVAVLQRGFAARDPFTQDDADVYRLLLDDVNPEDAIRAVRELVAEGQEFRPKPGAITARVRNDASRPTFAEAYELIFGRGGVLRAQPARKPGPQVYSSERERQQAFNDAAVERAKTMHPLVAAFVIRQGIDRLRNLPLEDPDWGDKTRRELEQAWDQHVEAFEDREVVAIAAGGRSGELEQLDPLKALGIKNYRAQLEDGQ